MNDTKTVVITGACGGIGTALTSCFKNAGYFVVATDQKKRPTESVKYDFYLSAELENTVNDPEYAKTIFNTIIEACPPDSIHVLVNNAAVQILGGLNTLTPADWHQTLDVNLIAPFIWAQGFASEIEKDQGSIINIGSIHARLTKKDFVAYATSKAALSGMTRALAIDVGSRIRVNGIEPAAIDTLMLKEGFVGNEEGYAELEAYHPLGRIGRAKEVGRLAVFLADKSVGFTHGATIAVDGGIGARLFDPA